MKYKNKKVLLYVISSSRFFVILKLDESTLTS